MALLRCSKCMLPETYETIEFDEKGICNICRSSEYKKSGIDWGKRKLLLDEIRSLGIDSKVELKEKF